MAREIRCDECSEKGEQTSGRRKVESLLQEWVLDVGLEGWGGSAGEILGAKRVGVCDGCGGWAQISQVAV